MKRQLGPILVVLALFYGPAAWSQSGSTDSSQSGSTDSSQSNSTQDNSSGLSSGSGSGHGTSSRATRPRASTVRRRELSPSTAMIRGKTVLATPRSNPPPVRSPFQPSGTIASAFDPQRGQRQYGRAAYFGDRGFGRQQRAGVSPLAIGWVGPAQRTFGITQARPKLSGFQLWRQHVAGAVVEATLTIR